jgi:glucose-1-phosphate thymidylyltransferase
VPTVKMASTDGRSSVKAVVLAGGSGTRLRPITFTSAKQLVPVANAPIITYGLRAIAAAGVTDVIIVVGDTADEIAAAIGDGSRFGLRVRYVRQEAPLGLAHALLCAADAIGDDDVLLYLGDNLIEDPLAPLVAAFERERPAAHLLLARVDDPRRFGVAVRAADGRIERLVEKPAEPPSDLALVGVYLFRNDILDAARALEPSARGEYEITDAIQRLIDRGEDVRSSELSGWWLDTGKKDDLLDANRILLGRLERRIDGMLDEASAVVGPVVVEPGASLVRSTVRGPAIIGAGTQLIDAYVGPFTSIGDGCVLDGCEVEFSVLMERCTVRGVGRVESSLLGRDVVVEATSRRPAAHRLLVGDHGRLELAGG